MCIIKSSDGFMWFGTWDGISRFDGHNFKTYTSRPGDSSKLKSTRIDEIVEDKAGYLWLKAYDKQIYRFDKSTGNFLAIADLLSKKGINNIIFDKIVVTDIGHVWLLTTNQGVFHINNAEGNLPEITHYSAFSNPEKRLPSNDIRIFFNDSDGNAWIETQKGLCLFKFFSKKYYIKYPLNNISAEEGITCMSQNTTEVWLASTSGMLYKYNKRSQKISNLKISNNKINAICVSKNNIYVYAVTASNELLRLNRMNNEITKTPITVASNFNDIYEDKNGALWLQPNYRGIVRYQPTNQKFKHFFQRNNSEIANNNFDVFEDNENRVWVKVKSGGMGYYDAESDDIRYFDNPNAANYILSDYVTRKYYDTTGVLWVSTINRGVEKIVFQRNDFVPQYLAEKRQGKFDNEVRGIYNDSWNRIWLATKNGKLYIQNYDGTRINNIFINEPVGGLGSIYTILQQKNGTFWLGTKGNGLFKAEPINGSNAKYKLTHYLNNKFDNNSLSSNVIYTLVEDKKERVWVGTFENGINLINEINGKIEFKNINNCFKNYPISIASKVRCLQMDALGNLWIGSTNGLLVAKVNEQKCEDVDFNVYSKVSGDSQSLGNNNVQFIFRDSKNGMWVATSGGGLNEAIGNIHTGLKFKVYTKEDGMPSNYVLGITEDISNNLWLSTENGLSKFNLISKHFRNYDSYDGLPQTVFSESSILKLSNNNILVACISGYLIFNPEKLTYQKIKAPLVFTNFQVNNKDVRLSDENSPLKLDINNTSEVTLKHNQNVISIDFTVLDYRSNTKQAYAYRLTGFDDKWNTVIDEHKATYTNLEPGDYIFEVKNINNELYTEEPFKSIHIKILPPMWRTWWAYIIYCIILVCVLEIIRRTLLAMIRLRNRISVEQRLTALKLDFFTNISHELRTPLTLIANPVKEVLKKEQLSVKGKAHLSVASKNINRMIRFVNQLLDFRKMQSGKMGLKFEYTDVLSFVREVASFFADAAAEKEIELIINFNVNELFAWIDVAKIDIVLYNILSNAFKFSENGTKISINVSVNDEWFEIEVIDEGAGVPQDKLNDIFELYYEVDNRHKKNHAGTGIGLALSKELILLHKGKIYAANNVNRGLKVTVALPIGNESLADLGLSPLVSSIDEQKQIDDEATKVITSPTQSNQIDDKPLVLLIDDNQELRSFLADLLVEHYRVIQAVNGKDGLEKAIESMPDLILSDVMMPEMDGIQLLDKLKNDITTSHIPVILLTAKSSIESQLQGLNYGADYYITKPFDIEFIIASINNLIKQRRKIFDSLVFKKAKLEEEDFKAQEVDVLHQQPSNEHATIVITEKDEAFLRKVIDVIENEMQNSDFNVDRLAELMLMGRTTFFKKFKSLTNIAPVEFIRDTRLKYAKDLLDAGETNLSTIAYQAGFSSTKYFSTCFKEKYGKLPANYIK